MTIQVLLDMLCVEDMAILNICLPFKFRVFSLNDSKLSPASRSIHRAYWVVLTAYYTLLLIQKIEILGIRMSD